MNQLIEGLQGIEVIENDFLDCGSGDTIEEAQVNHDLKLRKRQREGLKIESYKSETDQ